MKALTTALFLALVSGGAWAQTYKMTWTLTGFTAGANTFPWLELDIVETGRYLSAHGAVLTAERALSPVTGTCAKNVTGYFCHLLVDRNSYYLSLDSKLNGRITGRDAAGNALPEALATLHSRQ